MATETEALASAEETSGSSALRLIGWCSVGVAALALGIYLGRELRNRYKFNRRTPYDFYANSSEQQTGEFSVGI